MSDELSAPAAEAAGGDVGPVAAPTGGWQLTVYRVVQEALTLPVTRRAVGSSIFFGRV